MLPSIDLGVFDSRTGLQPFLSLAALYARYWLAVDYLLLFALFSGVARATIGRRLEGRPRDAAVAFGAADVQWQTSGGFRYAPERPAYEAELARVKDPSGRSASIIASSSVDD